MRTILSIVIPTYNRSNYLTKCLQSISECSKSTQNKIEVIICDNFSQDKTQGVIKNFIDKKKYLNRIINIRSEKLISAQQNWESGINIAKSSHILLLSDDDKVEKLGLEAIIKGHYFTKYDLFIGGHYLIDKKIIFSKVDLFIGGHYLIDKNGRKLCRYKNKNKNYDLETFMKDLSIRKIRHKLCSVIWRKELVDQRKVFSFKYPSNGICLDGAIMLASALDNNIYSSTEVISSYRVHQNNDCRGPDTEKFLVGREIFHKYGELLISDRKNAFYWFINWNIYGGIIQAISSIFRLKEFNTAINLLSDTAFLQNSLIRDIKKIDKKSIPGLILLVYFYFIKVIEFLRIKK